MVLKRLYETGKAPKDIDSFTLFQRKEDSLDPSVASLSHKPPPRIFSDRWVNIFFQEWAPLFPILNKDEFLRLYQQFVNDPSSVLEHHEHAQLHLVFAIANLSDGRTEKSGYMAESEKLWKRSLNAIITRKSVPTLQALILAVIFCSLKSDHDLLHYYKGTAVTIAQGLGLHWSQKSFTLQPSLLELRRKLFWTLYTVDSCASRAFPLHANY